MAATRKALPKDPETLRKLVLDDPNTAKIAEKLGVALEEYANQVVQFAMNPDAEPSLYMAEDADLKSIGWEPPDPAAMGRYLIEAVTVAEASDKTEFSDPKKKLVEMPDAAGAATGTSDPNLKAELEKQLKSDRGRKG